MSEIRTFVDGPGKAGKRRMAKESWVWLPVKRKFSLKGKYVGDGRHSINVTAVTAAWCREAEKAGRSGPPDKI